MCNTAHAAAVASESLTHVDRAAAILPRFYCDVRPNDSGARLHPYVVIDRETAAFTEPEYVIARFSTASDAEDFRDAKRAKAGVR